MTFEIKSKPVWFLERHPGVIFTGSVLIPSGTTMALNKLGVLVRIEYLSLAY